MANPETGEVDLEVGMTRYRLALGVGGLRAIQRMVSTPHQRVTLLEVVQGASKGDIEYLCALLWGALQRHHPEMTLAAVDQLLDELGGLRAMPLVLQKVNEMYEATGPDEVDQAALKKTAAPPEGPHEMPTATIGTTGTRSISKRAKSA